MFERGARIHDYEVWGRLGEGGMSEVWLAKHPVLSIPVVIKTLRKSIAEAAGDSGARRMFNEARLMARVTNPRVVRAIDAGVEDGIPFLVQEYVDGIDLAELDRGRRKALGVGLPLWVVCKVMFETCHALHAAHQAGVIHRDVKPSNLFAAPETGTRLGDFGIAVARADTPATEVSGTIKFMAPEQLVLSTVIDRKTDVYGAGATAFDLRYGRAPFSEVSEIVDMNRAAHFPEPKNPAEAYFQHLLAAMLQKDRLARPDDLAEPMRHFELLARASRPFQARQGFTCFAKNHYALAGCEISLRAGDIADETADAIVSSASYEMKMRTGVRDALRRKGGDAIEEEALAAGEQALGAVIRTKAGALKAKWVLHAVSAWNETSCVGRAMFRALSMADELGLKSIAFPALGTGSARVSIQTSASAMMTALRFHLALGGTRLKQITIVLGDEAKLAAFRDVADEALRGTEEGPRVIDLGLAVEGSEVRADGATQLDTNSGS